MLLVFPDPSWPGFMQQSRPPRNLKEWRSPNRQANEWPMEKCCRSAHRLTIGSADRSPPAPWGKEWRSPNRQANAWPMEKCFCSPHRLTIGTAERSPPLLEQGVAISESPSQCVADGEVLSLDLIDLPLARRIGVRRPCICIYTLTKNPGSARWQIPDECLLR